MDVFAQILTTEDIANKWNVKPQYVTKLAREGKLKNKKISGALLFLKKDVEEFERTWKKQARARKHDKRFLLNK